MSFHVARSSVVMPLLVAIRYRLSPRLTTTVAPYFGVDVREPSRTTVLEHAARASSASMASAATRVRDGMFPGRFVVVMRLAGLRFGPATAVAPCAATGRSAGQPLPQFARGHAAASDQDTEVDDRSHIGQVTQQYRDAVA